MKLLFLDREALAWAGGFFSGEGCTVLHRYKPGCKNKKPYPSVYINQTSVEELERFNSAIGFLGIVRGPFKPTSPLSRKMQYIVQAYGFIKTQAITAMLWPFLSTAKQEQATAVLKEYVDYEKCH